MKSQKITKRGYDDACGTAHGLELLGDRWTLLVVRELMLGARRFSTLRAALPGISANVLTQRLEELEARRILVRRRLPPPASAQVYELTDWGYEAEPVIQTLGRWAARSPAHDPTLPLSAVGIMLSFRTMLDVEQARGLDLVLGFRFGEDAYRAHLHDGRLDVARADPADAQVVLAGRPEALAGIAYGGAPFDSVTVSGDAEVARRFFALYRLPEKAA